MKKILFNDKYGLTQAVLEGRKTMTRRLFNMTLHRKNADGEMTEISPGRVWVDEEGKAFFSIGNVCTPVPEQNQPVYKIGDVVAIAQSYKNCGYEGNEIDRDKRTLAARGILKNSKGWNNKMFVRAEAMPHYIRITNIKVERLQDISEEDARKEGLEMVYYGNEEWYKISSTKNGIKAAPTAREAFSSLIDKISGKGTWERNPWVFAYSFKKIK